MDLRIEKVSKSKRKKEIKKIYTSSFLKEDRMPFEMMIIMSHIKHTDFLSFYDGDTLCGFIYMATIKKITFVMFFAVAEKLRSKGYGSNILAHIESMYPKNKIILTIEPCDKEAKDINQRIRRKRFYMKNGYLETGYFVKLGKKQEILIKNGEFDKREFTRFFMLYSNFTMKSKVWRSEAKTES